MSAPTLSQRLLKDINAVFDFVNFHPTEVIKILDKIEALRKYSSGVAALEARAQADKEKMEDLFKIVCMGQHLSAVIPDLIKRRKIIYGAEDYHKEFDEAMDDFVKKYYPGEPIEMGVVGEATR